MRSSGSAPAPGALSGRTGMVEGRLHSPKPLPPGDSAPLLPSAPCPLLCLARKPGVCSLAVGTIPAAFCELGASGGRHPGAWTGIKLGVDFLSHFLGEVKSGGSLTVSKHCPAGGEPSVPQWGAGRETGGQYKCLQGFRGSLGHASQSSSSSSSTSPSKDSRGPQSSPGLWWRNRQVNRKLWSHTVNTAGWGWLQEPGETSLGQAGIQGRLPRGRILRLKLKGRS